MPASGHSAPLPTASQPYRWVIGGLLGLGVLVNYFDRVNLSVSHDALVASFGISAVVFGQLSAAYSWTYAACQLPTGVILDRIGVRKVSLISIALWGIASLAAALAPGILLFYAARLLLGIGEAPTFPANAKAVGIWFPQSERSMATAIFDSAAKFANAIGVPLLGFLLLRIGWRWSFGVTAALSFGYLFLFALLYREPDRLSFRNLVRRPDPQRSRAETSSPLQPSSIERASGLPASSGTAQIPNPATNIPTNLPTDLQMDVAPPIPLTRLLRERKVIGLAIGFGSYNYVFYLLLTWLPTYLAQALHQPLMRSFLFTGAPWLVATACDLFLGGWLVDALIRRGHNADRVRRTVLLTGMVCGLFLLGAAFSHSLTPALVCISIAIGGLAAAAPVGWSLPSILVPNSSTGRVGGIVNFSNQLSAIAAPILTGYTVQHTHSYTWAFGIATAYLCIGIAAYLFLLGRTEPIDLQAALSS